MNMSFISEAELPNHHLPSSLSRLIKLKPLFSISRTWKKTILERGRNDSRLSALAQVPHFHWLKDYLRPGGVISTRSVVKKRFAPKHVAILRLIPSRKLGGSADRAGL